MLRAFAEHVPPPAHLALVEPAVERLLDDRALAARLGAAARARAVEEFVGDSHLTRYAELLLGLVAGPPLAPGPELVARPG